MFGAICSGRPVQIAQQVDVTKYVINLEDASNVNYLTIFLLPNTDFVDVNYTALIYFLLPPSQEFKLLGGINPAKPSAIYRLRGIDSAGNSQSGDVSDVAMDGQTAVAASSAVQIGILIEPTVQAQVTLDNYKAANGTTASNASLATNSVSSIETLANNIIRNAYNYLSGFVDNNGNVPMKAFDAWWAKFKSKLAADPKYLDKIND